MFFLHQVDALCSNYSNSPEKHGDEPVNAGDISISVDIPNTQLEQFDSALCDAMYRQALGNGEQPGLIGDTPTALRFPRVKVWHWGDEYTGCELEIGAGLNLAEPLVFVDVSVKKGFVLTPKEGGTVNVTFVARVHPDDEAEAGRLCFLSRKAITLSFRPPIKTEQPNQQLDLSDAANSDDDQLQQAADAMGAAA